MRSGVLEFAPSAASQNGSAGCASGSLSTDAPIPDALRDERTAHGHAGDVDGLSLFAPAREPHAAGGTICVGRISIRGNFAGESDRSPVIRGRNRSDLLTPYLHESTGYDLVAQPRSAHRNFSRGVRVVLRSYVAEVRHALDR